jgi:hypothetical protein
MTSPTAARVPTYSLRTPLILSDSTCRVNLDMEVEPDGFG